MKIGTIDFNIAPFSDTPDLRMFWDGHGCQQIFNSLLAAIVNGTALQTVIAEPGLGKTVLCRKLLNSLKSHQRRYRALYLPYPHQALDDTFVNDLLTPDHSDNRRTVLLIDEAQALPEAFLVLLTDWLSPSGPGASNMQAVLFGQPELEERLQGPALRALADLRTDNYQIQPFDRKQIDAYLKERITRAGAAPDSLLNARIVDSVWRASGGNPRLANTIMRKALLDASNDGSATLEHHHILAATASTAASVS